jgi:hypothetical protein
VHELMQANGRASRAKSIIWISAGRAGTLACAAKRAQCPMATHDLLCCRCGARGPGMAHAKESARGTKHDEMLDDDTLVVIATSSERHGPDKQPKSGEQETVD